MSNKKKALRRSDQDYRVGDREYGKQDEDRAFHGGRGGRNDHRPGSGFDEELRGDELREYARQDRYSGQL